MLHHVELYVRDLERSASFWTPFLTRLGYEPVAWEGGLTYEKFGEAYLCFLPAPPDHLEAGYHRKRIGLNHIAFQAGSRTIVDELSDWVRAEGWTLLYPDRHPHAGGPDHCALFCEDPDRIKVEVVAPVED